MKRRVVRALYWTAVAALILFVTYMILAVAWALETA